MKTAGALTARECTSMRAGGRLVCVFEADTAVELIELLKRFKPCHILGGGTNTIIADGETATPVVRLGQSFAAVASAGEIVTAGAALSTPRLLRYCAEHGLSGLEGLAGIPGQVGGAAGMNAGTGGWGLLEAASAISLADQDGLRVIDPAELNYGYRNGHLPAGAVVTGLQFKLSQSSPATVEAAIRTNLKKRSGQPKGFSSGCIFKNPPGDSAGRLIDSCGFKGRRLGGAFVSDVHANFILNDGTATTAEILALIALIKAGVRERFGIELDEEVKFLV